MRVMYDLNIVLDVLLDRQPHAQLSRQALELAELRTVDGYLCACAIGTLDYLLTRGLNADVSRTHLATLHRLLKIASVTQTVIDTAIALHWPDLEDAVVHESARQQGIDAIVTRDRTGFSRSTVRVYTPAELVAIGGRT